MERRGDRRRARHRPRPRPGGAARPALRARAPARRGLQNLDRYKTDLIATISHELKNPLTSVMGHLELIQPVLAETSAARSLGAISRNAARLEMMVEDLLLLSKVGDPTRPLIPVEVDLVPLLDDTVEMLRIQTERRGVALRLDHPGTPVLARDRGEPRAAGHQHRQQRDQVHALGPHRAGDARGARRPRHVHLPRRGARDLRGGPGVPVHRVLPVEQPRGGRGARHRSRADHRQADRGPAPRQHRRPLRAGEGSTFTIRIPSHARLLDTAPAEVPPTEVSADPAAEITAETPSARVEEPVSAGA